MRFWPENSFFSVLHRSGEGEGGCGESLAKSIKLKHPPPKRNTLLFPLSMIHEGSL